MLTDFQITALNRNSRWQPSAILDFPKFDFSPVGRLRPLIFHMGTKFGANTFIDAQITAQNRNSRWRLSAILEFFISPYSTTHEVFSLGYISLSNFVLIRYIILKIWGFDFLQNWLEMPIYAQKFQFFGVWTPKNN